MTAPPLTLLAHEFIRCRDMEGSLQERLDTYSRAVREVLPTYADAVDRLVERLSGSGAGLAAPRPGDRMPSFALPDERGRLISLDALLEKGPLAVTFHRGHWCPWCRISGTALARASDRMEGGGGHLVAIMPERQRFAAEFKAETRSPFSVLTDLDNGYALSLGLAVWVGPALERLLASYGRSLPEYQGNDAWMLPIPATFVLGTDGLVRARFVDPDFRRRASIEELLSALRAAAD
jgi:peroxiredoxin